MHWIGMRHDSMRLGYRKEIQLTRRIAQNVPMRPIIMNHLDV
jgi:hypothetical protein